MLKIIEDKINNQERLSIDEGLYLYKEAPLYELGRLATLAKNIKVLEEQNKHVYWNMNMHLNPTNICIAGCKFCAFAKLPNEDGAYTLEIQEAVNKVIKGSKNGAKEVHIVGGLNPKVILPYYTELLRQIKKQVPDIHIKAFTAVEIAFFARYSKTSYKEVLEELVKAGLDSMPGGGAEIFSKSVRDNTCPDKIYAQDWLDIHNTAHELGLYTNATMLAGIGESVEDRLDHLVQLREQQDKSKKFQAFIPLACHYEGTDFIDELNEPLTGLEKLKNIAISRLMLDNFQYIKAYWVHLGYTMAQMALHFGANDFDGTVQEERITNSAGSQYSSTEENYLKKLILEAGFEPVERNTIYQIIN